MTPQNTYILPAGGMSSIIQPLFFPLIQSCQVNNTNPKFNKKTFPIIIHG